MPDVYVILDRRNRPHLTESWDECLRTAARWNRSAPELGPFTAHCYVPSIRRNTDQESKALAESQWLEGQMRSALTWIADMLEMPGSPDLGYDVPREVQRQLGLSDRPPRAVGNMERMQGADEGCQPRPPRNGAAKSGAYSRVVKATDKKSMSQAERLFKLAEKWNAEAESCRKTAGALAKNEDYRSCHEYMTEHRTLMTCVYQLRDTLWDTDPTSKGQNDET